MSQAKKVYANISNADRLLVFRHVDFPGAGIQVPDGTVDAGEIIASEYHSRSPATREYTPSQVRQIYLQTGFRELKFYSEFSFEPAQEVDKIFSVVGVKPVSG
ncbi:MAG: hypothetical protein ACK2UM_01200 [Anaerolineales bacterium]